MTDGKRWSLSSRDKEAVSVVPAGPEQLSEWVGLTCIDFLRLCGHVIPVSEINEHHTKVLCDHQKSRKCKKSQAQIKKTNRTKMMILENRNILQINTIESGSVT